MWILNNWISLYWAVPVKIWNEEFVNLTWSATILEEGGKRFLIDLGLFQWWEWSELFNKQNIDFLNSIDWVVITHAHIDHVWRLPLLYKYGYRWPIFMTWATKDIVLEMLLDSLKIQEGEKIERLNRNKKLWNRLKEALKIKNYIFSLRWNWLSSENRQAIKTYLKWKLWDSYNEKDVLSQIDWYLDFYKVKNDSDIQWVIDSLKDCLFREEDISWVMRLIQTIDPGEEKIISSKQLNPKNENAENQELIDNLPEEVAKWFSRKVEVWFKSEKRALKQKWEERLKLEIKNAIEWKESFESEKEELRKSLEAAFTFYLQYYFLENQLKPTEPWYQNVLHFDRDPSYSSIKNQLKKNKKLLDRYWIKTRDDIDRLLEDTEKLVDILRISISFNSDDIHKAYSLLEVNNKYDRRRHVIWLTAFEAAHVVGSSSIMLISWIVHKKVNQLLDINWDSVWVYFSGDLGRIEWNRLGRPELPPYPVNYLQIESTYWWRDHRNKNESIDDLVNSIEKSKWNVLISVFSQQRLQEVILTILEEKIKRWTDFLDYEILVDAPLWEKLTNLYFRHEWEIFDLLTPKAQIEVFWHEVFRFLWEWEWEEVYTDTVIDIVENILKIDLNNQLFSEISDEDKKEIEKLIADIKLYNENKGLHPNSALRFINLNIKLIKELLWEDLFTKVANKQKKKKHIILASSGMMDGWAIMNHLPCFYKTLMLPYLLLDIYQKAQYDIK